jgi:hypothetical protein
MKVVNMVEVAYQYRFDAVTVNAASETETIARQKQ